MAKAEGYLWDAYGILSVVKGSSDPRTLTAQVLYSLIIVNTYHLTIVSLNYEAIQWNLAFLATLGTNKGIYVGGGWISVYVLM